MYIRRKVFSVLTDEMGEERLYSVNETLFEGYEYDEVDERMYTSIINGKSGAENVTKYTEAEVKKLLEAAEKGKISANKINEALGTAVKKTPAIKKLTRKEIKALEEAQKKGLKGYEKAVAADKKKYLESGVADIKKALRRGAKEAGKREATISNAFKNSSKLGKAAMIGAPLAAVGAGVVAGRASKRRNEED